jgi:hypothetical protein
VKVTPGGAALGVVGLAVGGLAVAGLREATLSTHQPVPPDSRIELVLNAATRGGEPGHTLDEMVEAQINTCRLEVSSDVVGEIEPLGDGRFRAVLAPSMDETDRRQFRGCIGDWQIDHVALGVVSLDELP